MSSPGFWTEGRVALLRAMWPSEKTLLEIGNILGCRRGAVQGKAMRIGLPKRGRPPARGGVRKGPQRAPRARVHQKKPATEIFVRVKSAAPVRGGNPKVNFVREPLVKMTKGEMMAMLKAAVENTK